MKKILVIAAILLFVMPITFAYETDEYSINIPEEYHLEEDNTFLNDEDEGIIISIKEYNNILSTDLDNIDSTIYEEDFFNYNVMQLLKEMFIESEKKVLEKSKNDFIKKLDGRVSEAEMDRFMQSVEVKDLPSINVDVSRPPTNAGATTTST